MDKYLGKYRVASARAAFWDYGWEGTYFITLCALNHQCLFGEIIRDAAGRAFLQPSPLGKIVLTEWEKSFALRPELQCDAFTLMPNHLHAVLQIVKGPAGEALKVQPSPTGVAYRSPKSISSFLAGFKSAATSHINTYRGTPGQSVWQTRFHDRIIRNEAHYHNTIAYVQNNPEQWAKDEFYRNDIE
jgi:REP element-mobilizing transposase RayT